MKKLFMIMIAVLMAITLTGCGEKKEETVVEDDSYKVAIIKLLDHASLDEIANAVGEQLDAIAEKEGVKISYEITSGQLDESTITQLVETALADKVDAIIPIATLTAQIAADRAADSKTPVVFAAISDPESAELTGIDYVTGTSDALNTEVLMNMIMKDDVKKVGLLYSLSEINSETPIKEAKAFLDAHNIEYVVKNGNTSEEVITAATQLIAEKVDAVFTPTDNVIMAAELTIAPMFAEAGIAHFAGADSFVRNGAYATCGVDYTDLGHKTADLAYAAFTKGMADMKDYYLMDGGIVTVNTETAQLLGKDYNVFKEFGALNEVITTID